MTRISDRKISNRHVVRVIRIVELRLAGWTHREIDETLPKGWSSRHILKTKVADSIVSANFPGYRMSYGKLIGQ